MTPKQLEHYLRQHALPQVLARAADYHAIFQEEHTKGDYFYQCRGSRKNPYTIAIMLDADAAQGFSTFCDCPYDGAGLCKHTVAALRVHVADGRELPAPLSAAKHGKNQQPDMLSYDLDDNGDIDFKIIFSDFQQKQIYGSYYPLDIELAHFSAGDIILKSEDYDVYRQTLRLYRQASVCNLPVIARASAIAAIATIFSMP